MKTIADFKGLKGKIGILGGTFDPVHNGHIDLARTLLEKFPIEKIFFMPTSKNPLKADSPVASSAERISYLEAAIENEEKMFVLSFEALRDGDSYTIETATSLKSMLAPGSEIYLFIGVDSLPFFHKWKRYEELFDVALAVFTGRAGYSFEDLKRSAANLSGEILSKIENAYFPYDRHPVSSTEVRKMLAAGQIEEVDIPIAVKGILKGANPYYRLEVR